MLVCVWCVCGVCGVCVVCVLVCVWCVCLCVWCVCGVCGVCAWGGHEIIFSRTVKRAINRDLTLDKKNQHM